MAFYHKKADFWLPNFGFNSSLLSLLKRRNDYKLKELKSIYGFKPMYDRKTLVISSEDME